MTMLQAVQNSAVSLLQAPGGNKTERLPGSDFSSLLNEIAERIGGHGGSGDGLYGGAPAGKAADEAAEETRGEELRGSEGATRGEEPSEGGEDQAASAAEQRPGERDERASAGSGDEARAGSASSAARSSGEDREARDPGSARSSEAARLSDDVENRTAWGRARRARVLEHAPNRGEPQARVNDEDAVSEEALRAGKGGKLKHAAAKNNGVERRAGAAAKGMGKESLRDSQDAGSGEKTSTSLGRLTRDARETAGDTAGHFLDQGKSGVRRSGSRQAQRAAGNSAGGQGEGGRHNDGNSQTKLVLRREPDLFQGSERGPGDGTSAHGTKNDLFSVVRNQEVQQGAVRQPQAARVDDSPFDQMVRQFNLVLRKGGGEARMQLHPENLGSMKLSVKLQRSELSTSIVVENQTVKELIMSRLPDLQESLAQQGFQISGFQVEVKDRGSFREESDKAGKPAPVAVKEAITIAENTMVEMGVPWMSAFINVTV